MRRREREGEKRKKEGENHSCVVGVVAESGQKYAREGVGQHVCLYKTYGGVFSCLL